MGLIIYTRRWMLFTRDETSQTCNSHEAFHSVTRVVSRTGQQVYIRSQSTLVGLRMRLATADTRALLSISSEGS